MVKVIATDLEQSITKNKLVQDRRRKVCSTLRKILKLHTNVRLSNITLGMSSRTKLSVKIAPLQAYRAMRHVLLQLLKLLGTRTLLNIKLGLGAFPKTQRASYPSTTMLSKRTWLRPSIISTWPKYKSLHITRSRDHCPNIRPDRKFSS